MKEANLLRHGRVEREDLAEGFDELKRRVRQAEVGPGQDREDAGVVIASKLSEKDQAVIWGSVCSAAVDHSPRDHEVEGFESFGPWAFSLLHISFLLYLFIIINH